jgi:hypothetical protein
MGRYKLTRRKRTNVGGVLFKRKRTVKLLRFPFDTHYNRSGVRNARKRFLHELTFLPKPGKILKHQDMNIFDLSHDNANFSEHPLTDRVFSYVKNAKLEPPIISPIINDAIIAMRNIGDNNGLVLGSGENTTFWERQKWLTCDYFERDADYPYDFEHARHHIVQDNGKMDYVFMEYFPIPCAHFDNALSVLKENGTLILETGFFSCETCGKLDLHNIVNPLIRAGFDVEIAQGAINIMECGFNTNVLIAAKRKPY